MLQRSKDKVGLLGHSSWDDEASLGAKRKLNWVLFSQTIELYFQF